MELGTLLSFFSEHECDRIYIKNLAANDNSKNQVYFGGSFDILNILPIKEIEAVSPGVWSKERFKAMLTYSWIGEDMKLYPAPGSQLILYPKYPEVRFSGFLIGCQNPPPLMKQRLPGRLLLIGVTKAGSILGYVTAPDSSLAQQLFTRTFDGRIGIFDFFDLPQFQNNKQRLLAELKRIHELGWIKSKRLDKNGAILQCESPNCGGYTLEAELGITPNGYSEPDFLGWEIKQFGVTNFGRVNSSIITLMTPEPTHGIYSSEGAGVFLKTYGYPDKNGVPDRINFGGVHKFGISHPATSLTLTLFGFDIQNGKIRNADGRIALVDQNGVEAASWSFSSLLLHWNRKHNQACYVPSLSNRVDSRSYKYGENVILGSGTDFQLFLSQLALGNIYYDPGIKMENVSARPIIKKRSQFRIKSQFLKELYSVNEIVNVKI